MARLGRIGRSFMIPDLGRLKEPSLDRGFLGPAQLEAFVGEQSWAHAARCRQQQLILLTIPLA